MIRANMKTYQLESRVEEYDPLGEAYSTFEPILGEYVPGGDPWEENPTPPVFKPSGKIEMSIFLKEQKNIDGDIRFREATHTGITKSRLIEQGQRVLGEGVVYEVLLVPQTLGRFTTVVLKEVV